ncbi:MAG: hypothetical protein GY769_19190 [bacterium]|nr:hypothetical protein [bacterium]
MDGQTRYEVARSLVDHGDATIRNQDSWYAVFPGRGKRPYTGYRLPQSLLGVPAVLIADLFGPGSEPRRHFFFVLTGALMAAALVVLYAQWFRHLGHSSRASIGWAALGLVCTPTWFYSTSTFDDVLGAFFSVLTVVLAYRAGRSAWFSWHLLAGISLAIAFHCKPPLAVLLLAVLVAGHNSELERGAQSRRRLVVLVLLLLGIGLHVGYERYKFPPESREVRRQLEEAYVAPFPGNPAAGVLSLAVSPGKGALWYFPAILIALAGVRRRWARDPWPTMALVASLGVFWLFIGSLVIFAGDPAWGPRYLTPVFAVLWLFVPAGARSLGLRGTVLLLALSFAVQLSSLIVDPHRLYVERGLRSAFYDERPWAYFDPEISHLVQRPREVLAIVRSSREGERASRFSPSPSPTFAFPILDFTDSGPDAVRRSHVLASYRPWWVSQRFLEAGQRPVPLTTTVVVLLVLGAIGGSLTSWGSRKAPGGSQAKRQC